MPTHKVKRQLINQDETLTQEVTITAEGEVNVDVAVADASTDFNVNVNIDVSALQSFHLQSDQDVTIETNNGTTPDDTFALKANKPLQWATGDVNANPFASAVDVTSLKVTNASGSTANIKLRAIVDATP